METMMGRVEAIFVAAVGGQPMAAVSEVVAEAGRGLAGDRYATRRGYWTGVDECQVTLIGGEDIDAIAAGSGVALGQGQHRRNLVTRGLVLSDLAGWRFRVGEAVFAYDRPRPPCRYIESITEPGMTRALAARRGGICARVLESGLVKVGDTIELLDSNPEFRPLRRPILRG
jgi:MOSC domain-containing protein YiiM